MGADDERIVLLDERGRAVGTAPKLASHHDRTPLHLAFSCYLFDREGNFLLTRRALTKKAFPGVWTNSFCGHPLPGEVLRHAVGRRLAAELGTRMLSAEVVLPAVRYRATMDGIAENEIGPVLRVRARMPLRPDPAEVDRLRWRPWPQFVRSIADGTQPISPWSRITVEKLAALGPDPWAWPIADPTTLPPALRQR
ncbi:isopentenyl-diphosphate Delta-isomerase [Kitasatospora phosalacinea]|uniref:isopentenyl-diphosphate Delta-isomerase n=1 Tax=Kitasatospora phosalacinea TaxID=2065 RepID=UPI003668D04E